MVLTEVSKRQLDYVMQDELSVEEVIDYLNTSFTPRTFFGLLQSLYPYEDMEHKLIEALDSRKNVQNWLNNRNLPTDREVVFRIAFALDIGEYGADALLRYVFEEGIHYRNEKELVYAFCLKYHQPYQRAEEALSLFEQQKGRANNYGAASTQMMKLAFDELPKDADFVTFLLLHQNSLGPMHETAYRYFRGMLLYLEKQEEDDALYSLEYICESYLRMGLPKRRQTKSYSTVQKMIKKYWPGIRMIKQMKNKKEDVNRKTLLLLYLVTGGLRNDSYEEVDEEYVSADEYLFFHLGRIDKMLEECGMRTIDPRNPFDFLLLYCMRIRQEESMSERMEHVIAMLFGE